MHGVKPLHWIYSSTENVENSIPSSHKYATAAVKNMLYIEPLHVHIEGKARSSLLMKENYGNARLSLKSFHIPNPDDWKFNPPIPSKISFLWIPDSSESCANYLPLTQQNSLAS